jgi:drug/metabolite transporter (DMT)-like permease
MIAILGGLGAALCFAISTLSATRASREIGAASTFASMAVVGLILCLPFLAAAHTPTPSTQVAWLALAGFANALGLFLEYTGLRLGRVGVVAPIASTEGAIAALIAVLAGEALPPLAGIALVVVAVGVGLVAFPSERSGAVSGAAGGVGGVGGVGAESLFGAGAALAFGITLYSTGHVAALPIGWVIVPTRLVGAVFVALPLAISRRLRLTRGCIPMVILAGVCETLGFVSYALGARHGIAIAAVLTSLFAVFAAIGAQVLLSERISPVTRVGIIVTTIGVATISAVH